MSGYWKIEKCWVETFGLTASEALVLADLQTGWQCTVEQRAKRCGLSREWVTKIIKKLKNHDLLQAYLTGEITLEEAEENVKKIHNSVNKIHIHECEENSHQCEDNSHRQCEENSHQNVKKVHIECEHNSHYTLYKNYKKNSHENARAREGEKLEGNGIRKAEEVGSPPVGGGMDAPTLLLPIDKVAAEFEKEARGPTEVAQRLERLFGTTRDRIADTIGMFADTLIVSGETTTTHGQFRRRFQGWLTQNGRKLLFEKQKNNARDNDNYIASLLNELCTSEAR